MKRLCVVCELLQYVSLHVDSMSRHLGQTAAAGLLADLDNSIKAFLIAYNNDFILIILRLYSCNITTLFS